MSEELEGLFLLPGQLDGPLLGHLHAAPKHAGEDLAARQKKVGDLNIPTKLIKLFICIVWARELAKLD